MLAVNRVILGGNLVADIEVKRLPSGMAVADLRLAISEKYKNKQGELVEKPVFVDVAVWDKQAENCAKYLKKGSPVLVDGRLQLDEWTSKEGEKRSKLRVRADSVQFLSTRRSDGDGAGSGSGGGGDDRAMPEDDGGRTPF